MIRFRFFLTNCNVNCQQLPSLNTHLQLVPKNEPLVKGWRMKKENFAVLRSRLFTVLSVASAFLPTMGSSISHFQSGLANFEHGLFKNFIRWFGSSFGQDLLETCVCVQERSSFSYLVHLYYEVVQRLKSYMECVSKNVPFHFTLRNIFFGYFWQLKDKNASNRLRSGFRNEKYLSFKR